MPTALHEYTQDDLDTAVEAERAYWQNAGALMLVARSGQVTSMELARRLMELANEGRPNTAVVRPEGSERTQS
jgi:phage FluMu protein gp41